MSAAMIEHNRRAVYTALSGTCDDRLLLERAFTFWEQNFAAQGIFRVAQYIDGLMSQVGLNQEQRRALSIALYSALNKQDRELSEVPAMFRQAAQAAAPVHAAAAAKPSPLARTPETIVLGKMIAGLVDGAVRAGKRDDLLDTLRETQSSLLGASQRACQDWIKEGLTDCVLLASRLQGREYSAVFNHVYVALCDAIGPVAADKVVGRAVDAAEQLPEAVSCPPRSLL